MNALRSSDASAQCGGGVPADGDRREAGARRRMWQSIGWTRHSGNMKLNWQHFIQPQEPYEALLSAVALLCLFYDHHCCCRQQQCLPQHFTVKRSSG